MPFEVLPTLKILRELLNIPRGMERFHSYLSKMIDAEKNVVLPIQSFNPMSKEHIQVVLDKLIEIDAEKILGNLITESFQLKIFPMPPNQRSWKIALNVSDDIKGGWTNRPVIEIERWTLAEKVIWKDLVPIIWWASEELNSQTFTDSIKRQIYEIAYISKIKRLNTLEEILLLRKSSLAYSNPKAPLSIDKRLKPYLQETSLAVQVACLFGDKAAIELGYPALGIH